ncbi:MAG TPA: class I SAM-dependent methyltransferase [Allosphingosinicella sp.]|jgi:SAM-dependent methyltransferase
MRINRASLAAAGLTLAVLAALAFGARCMSLTMVSCSVTSLWQDQAQLDVPYAGTRPEVVAAMLELASVGPQDHVVDLGTGDGRILIAAARDRGARGVGVDLDAGLIARAQRSARSEGVEARVTFRTEDLFRTPLAEATVLTMFLLPEVNLRLRPRILSDMRPGARVVSHAFDMADWRPDAATRVGGSRLYLWVVPARVEGRWRMVRAEGGAAELTLRQSFQRLEGTLAAGGRSVPVRDGRLNGAHIRFAAGDGGAAALYEGIVRGDTIEARPGTGAWRATRVESGPGAVTPRE